MHNVILKAFSHCILTSCEIIFCKIASATASQFSGILLKMSSTLNHVYINGVLEVYVGWE